MTSRDLMMSVLSLNAYAIAVTVHLTMIEFGLL